MYATDTSGATATLTSLVLAGYNDIGFKVKLVDGTATTDFCGIRECTSNGADVANGYTTDFNLDQLNLEVGEWYHFNITVLDDRFVLYCKETGENLRIWNDDGAPAYYKFVLYCDDDVSTIDFSDVRINKTSDDLSMFIKDKLNQLSYNIWSGGDYNTNFNLVTNNCSTLFVTENASNGDYCIKLTGTGWAAVDIPFSNDWNSITVSSDILTNSSSALFGTQVIYQDSYKSTEVNLPVNKQVTAEVSYDIDKTKTITKLRIFLQLQSSSESEAYWDNLNLIIQ